MAEIRVNNDNRGNNRSIWPWILGALLLVGLIWGIAELTGDDEREIEANRIEATEEREFNEIEEREPVRNENYEEGEIIEDENMRNELEEDEAVLENQ